MEKFVIEVKDGNVYINGQYHSFGARMDKDNTVDDMNKKILLALANDMGYEPQYLFEEMAERLEEILYENKFYCVCALGYDNDDRVTDYEHYYGDFDNYEDAYRKYVDLQTKSVSELFENVHDNVYILHILLQECEESDDDVNCIDIKNEFEVVRGISV